MINEKELGFCSEFSSPEEVEEMFESLTDFIGEQAENDNNRTAMVNPNRIKAVLYTYKLLKYLTKGTIAKVTYTLNEPYRSMGSVTVVGKNLTFSNPEWFMVAVKSASNFNVYPKTDGTVQMDFTFHGLTTTLD